MNKKRIIVSVLTIISIIGIGGELINKDKKTEANNKYTTIKGDLDVLDDTKLTFNSDILFRNYTTEISKDGIKKYSSLKNVVAELTNKRPSEDFIKENKKFFKSISTWLFRVDSDSKLEVFDDNSLLYMGSNTNDYNSMNMDYNLEMKGKFQDKNKNIKDINMKFNIKGMAHVYYTDTKFIKKDNDKLIIGLDISGIEEKGEDQIYKLGIITLDLNTLKYDISVEDKKRNNMIDTPIVVDNKNFYYIKLNRKDKKQDFVEIIKGDINDINKLEVVNKLNLENKLENINFNTGRVSNEIYFVNENNNKTLNLYRYNIKDNSFIEYKDLKFDILDTKGKESYIKDIMVKDDELILIKGIRKSDNEYIYESSTVVEVLDLNTNKSLYIGQFENDPYLIKTISEKN